MAIDNFGKFRDVVAKHVSEMAKANELFFVDVNKDDLWDAYLAAFPEGTNPIFKERTEHDCNCCKTFIRNVGGIVSIQNGILTSVWDVAVPEPYQTVANVLADFVRSRSVKNVFRTDVKTIGAKETHQQGDGSGVITWDHFYAKFPKKYVMNNDKIPSFKGDVRTNFDLLKRGVEEISLEAIDIVLELIEQNSLYRGQEHKETVKGLRSVKKSYDKVKSKRDQEMFLWETATKLGNKARYKNTVIGTLLVDLSSGVELERAVKSFEDKVAPSNYKRSSALITGGMIKKAEEKVVELGLEDALQRRFAVTDDLTINNVLFADRSAKQKMGGGVLGDLKPTATQKKPSFDKVKEIGIDDFIENVLPKAESVEVFVENKHTPNFVSLIAPVNAAANNMLKWGNNFSWSYNGEVADSDLRTAVASKGGRVDGVFRFSHMWNYEGRNASLMDLHVFMPGSTKKFSNSVNDSYGNHERVGWNNRKHTRSGGVQDVDYVEPAPEGKVPVENITFPDIKKMPDGEYECMIHNWQLRNPTNAGFKAEIEFGGQIFEYEVVRPLKNKEWIRVATVKLNKGVFTIKHHLPTGTQSKDVWGVNTEDFHKVQMVMNSPNHWDGEETGNKHWFFMLEECKNPEKARGFYNEFLRGDLTEHRKVFEVLSSKMKTEESDNQLSGLGFSSTQTNHLLCRVTGSFNRMLKITF